MASSAWVEMEARIETAEGKQSKAKQLPKSLQRMLHALTAQKMKIECPNQRKTEAEEYYHCS